nr:hypothetical protein [Tanacetum cinerariifolium]
MNQSLIPAKSNSYYQAFNVKSLFGEINYPKISQVKLKGALGDKIICDLDKTTDFTQRSPQNCPKCGNPIKGHYCRGCAALRKKFKEDPFASAIKHGIIQDSSEPSNDNFNVVNAPREPFIVNHDPSKDSSQSPSQINHHCCYGCGDPLEGIFCHQCTCKLCGNGAHYGYNCPPKVPIIPNPKPFNNQTIKELPPTVLRKSRLSLIRNLSTIKPLRSSHQLCKVLIPNLILFINLLTFSTHLHNFLLFLVNSARTMLVVVTIVHLKFRLSIRNSVTINTLIFRKNFKQYTVNHPVFNAQKELFDSQNKLMEQLTSMCDMVSQLIQKKAEENKIEEAQAANARYWKIPACYDDDDDYNFAITPNEPVNSLKFTTFLNVLFDAEFDSSDDQSCSDEDIDSLLDEFAGELTLLKSIPPRIEETDCDFEEDIRLIERLLSDNSSPRPPEEFVAANSDTEIESFSSSPIPVEDSDSLMEEIDLSFTPDYPMPPGIEDDDYDSERDILILKYLLRNDTLSIPEIESFHFDIPSFSRPHAKPPDGHTGILNIKMMDDIFDQKVPMPKLMITLASNQEKSPDLLSHQGLKAF